MPKHIDADAFIGWARTRYCKDCDKRKGMKNGKMRFVYAIGSAPCRSCDVDDMVEDVDNFPAADVEEVKHGEWINECILDDKWYHTCSNCNTEIVVTFFDSRCPNCGAKMDGKESGE